MIRTLAQELLMEEVIRPDDFLVVGVSGGPDSMALLHILQDLNRIAKWSLRLHLAHLDHQLRPEEGEMDAAFVQAAADSLGLPLSVDRRDVARIAQERRESVEETGRRERYDFFERVCLQVGARLVAVGHQADDNAETVLHRVLRGTGIRGLSGIPRRRPLTTESNITVVRPLLRLTRQQLLAYLSDSGIAYREDHTNALREPMRNRIRNEVMPLLEREINPQVREALNRLGEQAQWMESFLRETVQRTFETLIVAHTDQSLVLNAEVMARKSRIVQTELVRLAYRSFGLGEQDLTFGHIMSAFELLGEGGAGKQVQFPGGVTVERRYHQLHFSLPRDEPREDIAEEVAVHVPGTTVLPRRRLEIECVIRHAAAEDIHALRRAGGGQQEFLDLSSVHLPLVIRTRRAGDRFCPLGAPGSKKLSDFLSDIKVDTDDRRNIALLCDQLGPIWVIGFRIDDRVKLTELTRDVLHVQARSLET
ncbi:MAG: tRNA lysidine(34) synthetase TilS [Phycisphaerae bacterium]|nr:tRNA lysidine(34) synthetase TilS [Phycisphaerae bacterium]